MRRSLLPAVPVAAACLLASGCAGSGKAGEGAQQSHFAANGTFALSGPDLGAFDPYRNPLVVDYYLAYDPLVNQQKDGTYVSGLAEKWSADAQTATFTIKEGVTCSDGTPLTAGAVADAINYVSDPKNKSPRYGFSVPALPMKATGDDTARTVTVEMKQKSFGFLLNTVGQMPIMCPKGLHDPNLLKTGSAGTGPFVLTKVEPGQSYTFTVRKGYTWGPGGASTSAPGTPSTLVIKVIGNNSTIANLLLTGGLNFSPVEGPDRQRLDRAGLRHVDRLGAGAWLWFNHIGERPTADKRVRQALVAALDRAEVVKVTAQGSGGGPSTGLITRQGRPCTNDNVAGQFPDYDPAAAGSLLDGAGWVKGSDGIRRKNGKPLTLDVHRADGDLDGPTVELMAAKWKAIGIQPKITIDNAGALTQVMFKTSNYDVYMNPFGYRLPSEAIPYSSGPIPPKGSNLSGIHNPEYESNIAKASSMVAPQACQYWDRAEQALFHEFDLAPIANRTYPYYMKNAEAQINGYAMPVPTSLRVLK
jgi:peptide/nickel transport system substrate-binding protein